MGPQVSAAKRVAQRVAAASAGAMTVMLGRLRMTAMSSVAWWEAPSKASDMPQ